MENELGLLTDEDIYKVMKDEICNDKYIDLQGIGTATKAVTAAKAGAFLPFFIRGKFDISIISFPHLVERFELVTIITFGECVVGMTGFFDVRNLSLRPILVLYTMLHL